MTPPLLFCNIGWMDRYEGLVKKPDNIVGGGKYVEENENGGEVCNFVICDDGYIYGHVETSQNKPGKSEKIDRNIVIDNFGGSGDYVDGVDVVWTATHPEEKGRRIVGWYRNATVFRERQVFSKYPSIQHRRDKIRTWRIRAKAKDARRLDPEKRTLRLSHGPGWMGHTAWWAPTDKSPSDVKHFVREVRKLLDNIQTRAPTNGGAGGTTPSGSSGAPSDPYKRYLEEQEFLISPRHHELQSAFEAFITYNGVEELIPNKASVDLRYTDPNRGLIFAEIKPCDIDCARFAIRTAIGQLLDYRQRGSGNESLLIVVEVQPRLEDRQLAISNGFGVAFPTEGGFKVEWPEK